MQEPAIRKAEILSALSYALDLTDGQPLGHSTRCCMLGMRIAREMGVPAAVQGDLYYAMLLKDSGCSSNASRLFHMINADEIRAKRGSATTDFTRMGWDSMQYALQHVATGAPMLERMKRLATMALTHQTSTRALMQIRCERGAGIARQLGFSEAVADGIHSLHEHWNGQGYPDGLLGTEIPLISRIILLAQTMEVFLAQTGADHALAVARGRAGRWFDPGIVKAVESAARGGRLWADLDLAQMAVAAMEPGERWERTDGESLDRICLAFADVIDAKSPFTYRHSNGVATAATAIARQLGMTEGETRFLWRAALLHDIGKLSVPNTILEKPGKLTSEEWEVVKKHPHYTLEVLRRVPGFGELSEVAAAHHEKLDGSGYFRGWGAEQMNKPARILAVADIFDALSAKRPYRDALPLETVFGIMDKDAGRAIDAECLEALKMAASGGGLALELAKLDRSVCGTGACATGSVETQPDPVSR